MQTIGEGALLSDNSSNTIIEEVVSVLRRHDFDDAVIGQFTDNAVKVLDNYAGLMGEGTKIKYIVLRRFARIELRVMIPGEKFDPFKSGTQATTFTFRNVMSMNLNAETTRVSYNYILGNNIISVSIPTSQKRRPLYKDPLFVSVIVAVVLGLICHNLPADVSGFIVDDIAEPLMSTVLKFLAGITGPVIFISLTTSIVTLDSINDLTNLGFKIMNRFITAILFIMAVSFAVSAMFFRNFGAGNADVDEKGLLQMLFDIIPVNLIEPFAENNTPQLVVLGFLLGTALLLLGDRVSKLKEILMQVNEWVMSTMKIVLMATPAIPFLSIFISITKGNAGEILVGWKFIAASYIIFTICAVAKAVKTSVVTGISISDLWRKSKSLVMMSLATGSNSAPIKESYTVAEKEFNIKPEFSAFWIPMGTAMLSPKTTVYVVIAAFMVAEMTGTPVTISFLMVLILVTLELSIASPGTTGAWTIVFETLVMPSKYVGMFSLYKMFTENYAGASTEAYIMFEQVEAAYKLGGIKDEEPAQQADHVIQQ